MSRKISQFERKRCQKKPLTSVRVFSKMFCCTRTVDWQKFVHHIRMLCTGCFSLVGSVTCLRTELYADSFHAVLALSSWLTGQSNFNAVWQRRRLLSISVGYYVCARFFINEDFSRFSPRKTGWRKARDSLSYKKIVQKQVVLTSDITLALQFMRLFL